MTTKSTSAIEYFFYGEEFELWKLHTAGDYLYCFGFLAFGILVLVLASKYLKSQRDQTKAAARVNRRLKRLAKKPQRMFENVTLCLPDGEQTFDAVLMDKSGIYLVKTFGWGLKVFGTPDGEKWRLEDRVRKEEVPNPLIDLKKGAAGLQAVFEEKGMKRIKIMPMVVFADSFSTPELYLGYGSNSTTYQELKTWYRKQSGVKDAQYDFERAAGIIENEVIKNK